MKKSLFVGLTDFGAALKCLRALWAALPDKGRSNSKIKSIPEKKGCPSGPPQKKVPLGSTQTECGCVIPVSLLTPSPPDQSPHVTVTLNQGLAALACAEPGDLVLIATIPPGTVLTMELLATLDVKVVHKAMLQDLPSWDFAKVDLK